MDHQQGFIVCVGGGGRTVEGSSDHFFVVDHSELVMQLVAAGEAGSSYGLLLQSI